MHTIEFTCDSCNFQKKIAPSYNMHVFSILPFMFLWFLTYINLLLSTFFSYHTLFHALCLYLLHKSTSVYHTCTYTMMYCVCHLHKIYIFEIYTLTQILLCNTLNKLLILSSQKPYLSAPLIYVMKWVNMTYVLSGHVCFWQFAYLVTINFQEFSIIYVFMKFVHNHLFADSLKITFLYGIDRCFCYDIM